VEATPAPLQLAVRVGLLCWAAVEPLVRLSAQPQRLPMPHIREEGEATLRDLLVVYRAWGLCVLCVAELLQVMVKKKGSVA
jgi:hypothetical protein